MGIDANVTCDSHAVSFVGEIVIRLYGTDKKERNEYVTKQYILENHLLSTPVTRSATGAFR